MDRTHILPPISSVEEAIDQIINDLPVPETYSPNLDALDEGLGGDLGLPPRTCVFLPVSGACIRHELAVLATLLEVLAEGSRVNCLFGSIIIWIFVVDPELINDFRTLVIANPEFRGHAVDIDRLVKWASPPLS